MPGVKAAISLDEDLLVKVDRLAGDLHVSRSRVFTLAMENFLKKQENQLLLERLNEAYEAGPATEQEKRFAKARRAKHARVIGKESW